MTFYFCDSTNESNAVLFAFKADFAMDGLGIWISRCKLLYIHWINNKILLHSTGNYVQCPMINHNGKEYEEKNVYI